MIFIKKNKITLAFLKCTWYDLIAAEKHSEKEFDL
jgi:hypothetical protein